MKNFTLKITLSTVIFAILTSCSSTQAGKKYNIDKHRNMMRIQYTFNNQYAQYNTYKAMAVAFDKEGKYTIGYSYDANNTESAKRLALMHCQQANASSIVPTEANCHIYAIGNQIVSPLK